MAERVVLVHYHEVALKGRNRFRFERRLRENLDRALVSFPVGRTERVTGRLVVPIRSGSDGSIADVAARIAELSGVVKVSIGWRTDRDLDSIAESSLSALAEAGEGATFRVTARRSNTDFAMRSMDLAAYIGARILKVHPDLRVDLTRPDIVVATDVVQGSTYVYARSIPGIGGLPAGSEGRVISLLSSGIDSPVATWKIMRRGAVAIGVHFSGAPYISSESTAVVHRLGEILERTGGLARIHAVAFGDIQRDISLASPPALRVLLYRRTMIAIAEAIAQREGARALVTGESLGQVASQTLDNIRAVDAVATLPLLRPLIGDDKHDIIDLAERIGTFELSSMNADDCCTLFMPRSPETHAKLSVVDAVWRELPVDDFVRRALDGLETRDYSATDLQRPR